MATYPMAHQATWAILGPGCVPVRVQGRDERSPEEQLLADARQGRQPHDVQGRQLGQDLAVGALCGLRKGRPPLQQLHARSCHERCASQRNACMRYI